MLKQKVNRIRMISAGVLYALLLWAGAASAGTTLSGVVLSSDEFAPVADVGVLLQNDNDAFTTVTADDGLYIFADVPAGEYTVSIAEANFIPAPITVALGEAESLCLDLVAEPESTNVAAPTAIGRKGVGTAVRRAATIKGNWSGPWKSTDGSTGTIKMSVSQQGSKIFGNISATNTDCGTVSMPYTGTLSGAKAKLQGTTTCQGYLITLKITGKVVSKKKITGQWALYVNSLPYDRGSFTLTKR